MFLYLLNPFIQNCIENCIYQYADMKNVNTVIKTKIDYIFFKHSHFVSSVQRFVEFNG